MPRVSPHLVLGQYQHLPCGFDYCYSSRGLHLKPHPQLKNLHISQGRVLTRGEVDSGVPCRDGGCFQLDLIPCNKVRGTKVSEEDNGAILLDLLNRGLVPHIVTPSRHTVLSDSWLRQEHFRPDLFSNRIRLFFLILLSLKSFKDLLVNLVLGWNIANEFNHLILSNHSLISPINEANKIISLVFQVLQHGCFIPHQIFLPSGKTCLSFPPCLVAFLNFLRRLASDRLVSCSFRLLFSSFAFVRLPFN